MPNDSVHPEAERAMSLLRAHIQHHHQAADTFEGIARWWMGRGWQTIAPEALQIALDRLVAAGTLRRRQLPSGEILWYAGMPQTSPGGASDLAG